MVAELDRASKLLVRRDLELTRINAELDDKYKELKAEKKKIEGIFMSFSDGLFFFDSEGNIRMVNPMAREIFDIKEEAEGFDKLILAIKDKRIKKKNCPPLPILFVSVSACRCLFLREYFANWDCWNLNGPSQCLSG